MHVIAMDLPGQISIPCALIRGGTSRGAYFLASDLPTDSASRDQVLLRIMGGPDALQIDGLGGGHPLTSKVAIVSASTHADADVDYLFLQVSPSEQTVRDTQNCGNILAGIGPFVIHKGLVEATDNETLVRVQMLNSGNRCELVVPTPGRVVAVEGKTSIDGVPGSGAPIVCNYMDVAGSVTGKLLPTGNIVDLVDDIEMTCIDNGMPLVIIRAEDLGVAGTESPEELEANDGLRNRIEAIRLQIGSEMQLGDVSDKSVPKMCLVSEAADGGLVNTRTFIPHACHRSIGVLGAVSVATACLLPESVAAELARIPAGELKQIDVEHPSGSLRVSLQVDESAKPEDMIRKAGVVRTARTIMTGEVLVPPTTLNVK